MPSSGLKHFGGAVAIDTKALAESGEFEGYGAVFGTADQGSDIIMPGAFAGSLSTRVATVKMLWQHDPGRPIGKWLDIAEDGHGLRVVGKLSLGIQSGRETYEMMRDGIVDGLSIGYRTKAAEVSRDESVRRLLQVELEEVSVVTFPMHRGATVSLVKAMVDDIGTLSDAESALREAGYSRKDARDFVSRVKRIAQREAGDDLDGLLAQVRAARKAFPTT